MKIDPKSGSAETQETEPLAAGNDTGNLKAGEDSFRDSMKSIDKASGKRVWIYPRKPKGRYYSARTVVSVLLLAIMVVLPLIKVNGEPLVLLNIIERKFIIFGLAFWPQDFHIFALAVLAFIIFIVLFTAIYGRVWCGWACPQTIFMEMVFRKIEYWIEGDSPKQRALRRAPWTGSKIFKKTLKHGIFFALSFLIGNLLLSYIIGVDDLWKIVTDPIDQHTAGLTAMVLFSLLTYGVFARFREQVCIYVCPYGRLQSVLLDKNSVVVSYDFKRGEPRGKIKKSDPSKDAGDCIDCEMCVHVCPTGIDIRDGTQLECVNCTACMDACDAVMDKIDRPKRLIRYASFSQVSQGQKFAFTGRIGIYSVLLVLLLGLVGFMISSRGDVEMTILRTPGQLYQLRDEGFVSNLYSSKIVNKTFEPLTVTLKIEDLPGRIKLVGNQILTVPPDALLEVTFFVELPRSAIDRIKMDVDIGVYNADRQIDVIETTFLGPVSE